MTGTARNTERTGKRRVTRLSTIARTVENIRAIDVDLVTYCPRCKYPQAFCEVKSVLVSDAEWDQMRRHAAHYGHGCIAILVVDSPSSLGVKIYNSADGSMSEVNWSGEEYLKKVLERARDVHQCR